MNRTLKKTLEYEDFKFMQSLHIRFAWDNVPFHYSVKRLKTIRIRQQNVRFFLDGRDVLSHLLNT